MERHKRIKGKESHLEPHKRRRRRLDGAPKAKGWGGGGGWVWETPVDQKREAEKPIKKNVNPKARKHRAGQVERKKFLH